MRYWLAVLFAACLLQGCVSSPTKPGDPAPSGNFYDADLTPTNNGEGLVQ